MKKKRKAKNSFFFMFPPCFMSNEQSVIFSVTLNMYLDSFILFVYNIHVTIYAFKVGTYLTLFNAMESK